MYLFAEQFSSLLAIHLRSFAMESQYNQLLSLSKTVGAFYEDVYAPVLQALPWIDDGTGLKTASEKVLSNITFPTYELSNYKNQKASQQTIAKLRQRCDELESIYHTMQDELRPLLEKLPLNDRSWEKLKEMVPKWKNLNSSDALPLSMHQAVEESFFSKNMLMVMSATNFTRPAAPAVSPAESVLGKLMAEKIKSMHAQGKSDHDIAVEFGSHGLWLERSFLHAIR